MQVRVQGMWLGISVASGFALTASLLFVLAPEAPLDLRLLPACFALIALATLGVMHDIMLKINVIILAVAVFFYGYDDGAPMWLRLLPLVLTELMTMLVVSMASAFEHLDHMFKMPVTLSLTGAMVATIMGALEADVDMIAVPLVFASVCAVFAWAVWQRGEVGLWRYVPLSVIVVHSVQAVLILVPHPPLDMMVVTTPTTILYVVGTLSVMAARDFFNGDSRVYNDK